MAITVYNYRKKQTRYYLLSVQRFPELIIGIKIKKHQRKINAILINVTAIKEMILKDVKVELISSKREFNYYSLQSLISLNSLPLKLDINSQNEFILPFEEFRSLLMDGEHPFRTFRFLVVSDKKQTYKSHELGFDKKWVIYRPDTGKYN